MCGIANSRTPLLRFLAVAVLAVVAGCSDRVQERQSTSASESASAEVRADGTLVLLADTGDMEYRR
jgi:hypothetical protein